MGCPEIEGGVKAGIGKAVKIRVEHFIPGKSRVPFNSLETEA